MMFASKTPRDLNRDPYPFESDGERISRALYLSYAPAYRKAAWLESPRPEYDHPQNNEPNAILVAFRGFAQKHGMDAGERADLARAWRQAPTYYERRLIAGRRPTIRMRAHAHRVLNRLANLETRA